MARVCPFWCGYLLLVPLRRLGQSPAKILGPFVREGMAVLEVGPAMGYFSLPMAERVGPSGRVYCVDIQERMLEVLERRAAKRGLLDRIEARLARTNSLGLDDLAGRIDFALAFAVVHEVPDAARLLSEVHAALKPGAVLLVGEPKLHVRKRAFAAMLEAARAAGFDTLEGPAIRLSRSAVLRKPVADRLSPI
jgi:2-polyprenyl-3-methyl-5-hydroxy-6-metoxy-1,4-benzoquinol methylase